MEEIDNIVIHTLKQLGCEVDDDITSLRHFSVELIVDAVVKCLRLINPSLEQLPSKHLGANMIARYNAGAALATACQELGYNGDIGYQTFLYSNETELRNIFLFLFEKLPKESEKIMSEPLGKAALLRKAVELELKSQLAQPWLPPYAQPSFWKKLTYDPMRKDFKSHFFKTTPLFVPNINGEGALLASKAQQDYEENIMQPIANQVPMPWMLGPSLLESHALSLVKQQEAEAEWNQRTAVLRLSHQDFKKKKEERIQKKVADFIKHSVQASETFLPSEGPPTPKAAPHLKGSRFKHQEKLQFTSHEDEVPSSLPMARQADSGAASEPSAPKPEDQINALQSQLQQLTESLQALDGRLSEQQAAQQRLTEALAAQENVNKEAEESYKVHKRTADLVPDGPANLERLQAVVDAATKRLMALAAQWEEVRKPLLEEYRALREAGSNRLNETQKKMEEIRIIKEKIKDLAEEARHKNDVYKQLQGDYEKLTKDVSRSAYTRRILEIVGNIKKQKAEIDKILLDTKSVQKEINRLSGKLERTFIDTDELIFKNARKDEAVRKAYKYLAALHENCNLLIQTVEENGAILREIRDLEDQIEQEQQKKVAANLDRITADYEQMKKENAVLISHLKGS